MQYLINTDNDKSKVVKLVMEIKYFQTYVNQGNKNGYWWWWCKLGIKNWKWWTIIECRRAASQHNKVKLLKVTWHAYSTSSIFRLQLKHFVQYQILYNRLQVHAVLNIKTGDDTQFGGQVVTFHTNLQWISEPSPKMSEIWSHPWLLKPADTQLSIKHPKPLFSLLSLLSPRVIQRILFSNTIKLCSSPWVREVHSHIRLAE